MHSVTDDDAVLICRGWRILSQLRCCVDLFPSNADFNVNKIRGDAFEVGCDAEAGSVGDVKEAGLIGNDVILRHRSSQ